MNNDIRTPKPFPVTIYHSGYHGNAQNCRYPYSGTGSTPEELKKLFCHDHTFIRFKTITAARRISRKPPLPPWTTIMTIRMIPQIGFPSRPFPGCSPEFPVWSAPAATI